MLLFFTADVSGSRRSSSFLSSSSLSLTSRPDIAFSFFLYNDDSNKTGLSSPSRHTLIIIDAAAAIIISSLVSEASKGMRSEVS
jgi:hypothetical protein